MEVQISVCCKRMLVHIFKEKVAPIRNNVVPSCV